jgi:hypothetical protein
MIQKDLAEEYALKEYKYINEENDLIFEDNKCFTFDDIKEAFNAGRESIIENIPRLNWEQRSADQYTAETPFEKYIILERIENNKTFYLVKLNDEIYKDTDLQTLKLYIECFYLYKIKQTLGV